MLIIELRRSLKSTLEKVKKGGSIIKKFLIYSFILILILFGTYLLLSKVGFFETTDEIREPISVNTIDWEYLSWSGNEMRIDSIAVYSPGHNFGLGYERVPAFCRLMLKNNNKIYQKENNHSIKIHIRFAEAYVINSLYKIDEYNGKESTFYVDNTLVPALKKIYRPNSKN